MGTSKKNNTLIAMELLADEDLLRRFSDATLEFSSRETQVLDLVAEGKTLQEIAVALRLSEASVRTYRAKALYRIRSRARVVVQGASITRHGLAWIHPQTKSERPPINAEYVLYLLLRRDERDFVIGDLVECYSEIVRRFGKRRADFWFYKQVLSSLWPLLRRAALKIGALVWLGRVLRRFIS